MSCWRPAVDLCVFYSKIRQTGQRLQRQGNVRKGKKKINYRVVGEPEGEDETVKRGESALELIYSTNGIEEAGHRPHYAYIRLARVDREPNNQKAEVFDCIAEGQCHK